MNITKNKICVGESEFFLKIKYLIFQFIKYYKRNFLAIALCGPNPGCGSIKLPQSLLSLALVITPRDTSIFLAAE